jgi:hypothetical protein
MNRILAAFIVSICIGCGDVPEPPKTQDPIWSSSHHPVRVSYGSEWTRIEPSMDTADKLLVGLVDNSNGMSYTVKIGRDVDRNTVPDTHYYDAVKKQMLAAHGANKLIDEGDVAFHGRQFHRLRFKMHTAKWGELCMLVYTHRTGTQSVAVQIAFPFDPGTIEKDTLPPALSKLDANTQLFADEMLN